MAFSKRTLKLFKWLYWIFLILVQLYITYIFFASDRIILGCLWLVTGFILIFVFYFYYFPLGDPGSSWPPYITPCPDYMTQIAPGKCVDYVGLHAPSIKKSDPSLPPPPLNDASHVFDGSGSMSQKAVAAQQNGLSWEGVL